MTLSQLLYFQTASHLGSITKAAEQLHISQPSVSIASRSLENEVGLTLLDRSGRGFALTKAGRLFLLETDRLLTHADDFEREMKELAHGSRTLQLGIPPMIGSVLLPVLLGCKDPGLPRLQIVEHSGDHLMSELEAHKLDMAFVPHSGPVPELYESLLVMETESVLCIPAAHPLASYTQVSVDKVEDLPLVLQFQDGGYHSELLLERFRAAGIRPDILLRTNQLSTIQELIRRGRAAGFLFSSIAETIPGSRMVSLDPPFRVSVSIVWRKDFHVSRSAAAFLRLVESLPYRRG